MPDFPDTIIVPRRQTMPFEPEQYRKRRDGRAACRANACQSGDLPCPTPDGCRLAADDDEDSEFGALEGLTRGSGYIAAAWAIIAATAVAAYLSWW